MTRTLGEAFIQIYVGTAALLLPVESQKALVGDLEKDPFVEHMLNSATCELYHRCGKFLAPLAMLLTTVKHCRFEHKCPPTIDITDTDEQRTADGEQHGGEAN